MLVAVYGTLKRGYGNHRRMLNGYIPLQSLFIEIPFHMYATDAYPMILPSLENHPIYVEVFEVDAVKLAELDRLEAPYNFHRETIFVAELHQEVEIYVFSEIDPPSHFTLVDSGEWDGGGNL